MSRKTFAKQIIDPKTYADDQVSRALFRTLRHEDPVHWVEIEGFEPFWAITKHADVTEVELQADIFINQPRGILLSIAETEKTLAAQGGRAVDTIVSMDGEDHRLYRGLTRDWFLPGSVRRLEDQIRRIAREFIDVMAMKGNSCDFARDVANWYPLRVITMILGIPAADEPQILQTAQELFGGSDPEIGKDDAAQTRAEAMSRFFEYFGGIAEDRRKCPRDDLASVIANGVVRGEPINQFATLSYYLLIGSAGHDTTSSSISGGMLALLQHPEAMQKLRSNRGLITVGIEEMFRWVSPVKHFFRTATQDYVLRGKQLAKGDSLMMCYPSANFDEDVFQSPMSFEIDRSPNRHLAFGIGPHFCLGQPLARLETRIFFEELLARFEHIELAGVPTAVEANFISGLKTLPIRFQ